MFFDFIRNHYELIISVITLIISIIVFILRKKPVKSIITQLYEWSIIAVRIVELTNLKGNDKLEKALEIVNVALKKEYPTLDILSYRNTCVAIIEEILSTPSKK